VVENAFSLLSIVRRELLGDVHMVFNFLSLLFLLLTYSRNRLQRRSGELRISSLYPVVAITNITIFTTVTTTTAFSCFDLVSRGVFYGKFKSFGANAFFAFSLVTVLLGIEKNK